MKRIYYLTGSIDSTEQIANDLHEEGITDWNFHVHSKDVSGLFKKRIHSANFIQRLDIIRYGERGAMIGFAIAMIATAYIMIAKPLGPQVDGLVYVTVFGFITLFGGWVGGLAGLATDNQKITMFHDDIESGKYLILIDVRRGEEEKVKAFMARKHPEAELRRVGSTYINPFKLKPATSN